MTTSPSARAPEPVVHPSASATLGEHPPFPEGPSLSVLVRPVLEPVPAVHVEIVTWLPGTGLEIWRLADGMPDRISNVTARDGSGDILVRVSAAAPGVALTLARSPGDALHLSYDVRANDSAPDDPFAELVLDDRFRAAGEGIIALPEALGDGAVRTTLRIDGEALRASNCASSFGVGRARQLTLRPRALRYATFMAGSIGAAVMDDPAAGHDEAAWLGYTAFDPRPAAAEVAQIRSSLGDLFKAHDEPPSTFLVVSQTRPIGSFFTSARAASVLLQVGPAEPWSAPVRLSIAQQLARRWVGGALRIATEPGHEAESWWFSEGVARFVAMHVLSHLGLATPADVRDEVAGQLAVLATSGYGERGNVDLAAIARTNELARATLVARGALYAAREEAVLRARTRGERGLDSVLVGLLTSGTRDLTPFPPSAWIEALSKEDPAAAHAFEAIIVRGSPIALPDPSMGPCFRAGRGEYVAFDPGFSVSGTRESKDGRVVDLRKGGPADKAGLRDGDVVAAMTEREGDARVPVKLVVTRSGAKVNVTYLPAGARGVGQTWTRARNVGDERCGELL